ncbi:MAG: hypothetical protein AB7P94_17400 [Steroidobacteraceae bacterium]
MTIQASASLGLYGNAFASGWQTELDASDAEPKEVRGAIRYEQHPVFGVRGFQYLRCNQSGGTAAGAVQSFVANTSISNITSGTTTTITTSGLTADIHVGGFLYCLDDAGAAGAAPEGEYGRIVANTATLVRIDSNDAFSVAPAANDDFVIINPFSVVNSADGDFAYKVAGVAMATLDQYDWGWFQFYGINPTVNAVAAGTAIITNESVVANTKVVNDGAGDAAELRIGVALNGLTTDTVKRSLMVKLFCGAAFPLSATA